jgi:glycosyltransferase involved in cell wall biosynthesis
VIRVALLTEIPAPFRIPLFNELAARERIDLRVLFLSEQDPKRPYPVYADEMRFAWRVLPGREVVRGGRWIVLSSGAGRALRRFDPHVVVVGGWNQPAFWRAALHARLRRRPLVAWVESTARDVRPGRTLTEWPKRALIRACAAFLVPGRASADYLRGLGVADERIAVAPNAVDTSIFSRASEPIRFDRKTVLYVGRLDPEKGVDVLLGAMRDVDADLLIVSHRGSDEARLRGEAPPNVRFAGRVVRDELARWYGGADVFVLPSRSDQWGMVLNEAAAAGLPLVATEAPGAAHDLIEHGVNGFRVPIGDERALADALRRVLEDDAFRARAGARSRELAQQFTPAAWADAVERLARELVSG